MLFIVSKYYSLSISVLFLVKNKKEHYFKVSLEATMRNAFIKKKYFLVFHKIKEGSINYVKEYCNYMHVEHFLGS